MFKMDNLDAATIQSAMLSRAMNAHDEHKSIDAKLYSLYKEVIQGLVRDEKWEPAKVYLLSAYNPRARAIMPSYQKLRDFIDIMESKQ